MASTPLPVLFFLAWLTTNVHSEKVLKGIQGSTVVLSPGLVDAEITSIRWKQGDDLVADWYGRNAHFFNVFKDYLSLDTQTGDLIINDVTHDHGAEYIPEINNRILDVIKLQVVPPVPKPSITMNCDSAETICTLRCTFDRTDDLEDVEIFWILDDRREKGGSELQITKETKEESFICSLNNSDSSAYSTELQNPFFTGRDSIISRILVGQVVFSCLLLVVYQIYRCTRRLKICRFFSKRTKPVKDSEQMLLSVRKMILKFFRERDVSQPYDERERLLLKVHKMIVAFFREQMKGSPFEEELNSLDDPNTPEPAENQDPALFSETIPQPDFPDGNISTFERSEQMLPPDSRDL